MSSRRNLPSLPHALLSHGDWLSHEDAWLAPFAMPNRCSRGRKHPEPVHPFRTDFQRDRERIVHSSAFRRMTGKTQVLVASVNDHHRTRLTHTLEVAQVARTVARRLRLNEDLTEAIALAHDLGHPPFGHAGEKALNECLASFGGFNHNLFGLRRVDQLEERYPEFPGLNLTYELREAFVRHAASPESPEAAEFFIAESPLLEAQVVDIVDSIAYDAHDIDDALGLGFVTLSDMTGVRLWQQAAEGVLAAHPRLSGQPFRTAVVRELLARQVTDLLTHTAERLTTEQIGSLDDVRAAKTELVGFSPEMATLKAEFERFMRERVYSHHRVLRMTASGKRILKALFQEYVAAPELLPEKHLRRWADSHTVVGPPDNTRLPGRQLEAALEQVVGDYLAGMTDRYAHQEYRRLFTPTTDL